MKNSDYEPEASRMWMPRVEYLLTYQPKWIARMFKKDRDGLYEAIAAKVDEALEYQTKLMKQRNMNRLEIAEAAQSVIAPTEAIPPEDRGISEELYEDIIEWAEDPLGKLEEVD